MKQGAGSSARPLHGARVRVIRGRDARAVARAVRDYCEEGIALPTGPYRYPYAAVCALLRNTGLFTDPTGETATDPVLSPDALVDGLRELLARGALIGVLNADSIDASSACLLGRFAATAQLAVENGLNPGGLVLGTVGDLPPSLKFENAAIVDVADAPVPPAQTSSAAQHVLELVAGAPHPVTQAALRSASGLSAAHLQTALVELAAGEFVEIGERIGLGPAACTCEARTEWLGTPEVRLPLAALCVTRDRQLARHLGTECLQRGDHESAVFCFGFCELERAGEAIAYGHALACTGKIAPARQIFEQLEAEEFPQGEILALGKLGVLLAECNELKPTRADRLLKRVDSAASRAWRARMLVMQGKFDSAKNLLRRTTRNELERESRSTQLEHELALVACLRHANQGDKADKKLVELKPLYSSRAELRRLGLEVARLAALELDAGALRKCGGGAVLKEVLIPAPHLRSGVRSAQDVFAGLRAHGATLLAALEGEALVVVPPGALARPGLAAQVRGKLRRMREHPQAFSFGSEEFDGLGPFAGRSTFALQRKSGPMFVLFRPGLVPDVAQLLKEVDET